MHRVVCSELKVLPGAVVELRHLRYLVAVADAGTFVRAAEQLRIAQPALSRQLRDLQHELDVDLLESGARKATLTPAGKACVRLARHVLQDTERAIHQARLSKTGLAGRCVLTSGPYPIAAGFVAAFVERMKTRYPDVQLVVQESIMEEQWDAIAHGEADIGLGVAPLTSYATLSAETQFVAPMNTALIGREHPLASRGTVTVADLAGLTYVTLAEADLDRTYEKALTALKAFGFPEDRVRTVRGIDTLIGQVFAGEAWTLAPEPLRDRFPPLVGLHISDLRVPMRTVRIWRRADDRPVIRTILNELRQMQVESREAAKGKAARNATPVSPSFVPARLELRHLRSFAKVAKYGSLGRAAGSLKITQPALSRQMRDLEYDVGVQLLDRGTRGMHLTAAGKAFLGDVHGLLSVADHLRKEVKRAKRGASGRCEIAVVPHPQVARLLGFATAKLADTHPQMIIHTRSIPSPKHTEALQKSEVDVVVGFAFPIPPQAADGLIRQRLVDDEICTALVAIDHPLAQRDMISLSDLRDMSFLFGSRAYFARFYDTVMQQFAAADFHPRIDSNYERLPTVWSLIAQGAGWTLGWRSLLAEAPAGTRAVRLRDFRLGWGADLVYRQDESRATILAVIDAFIEGAARLADSIPAGRAVLPSVHTSQAVIS